MTAKEFFHLRLAPFKSKNFRRLFFAQGLSLVGSWMQELAKSWIVLGLVGNARSMGALLFASAVPNLVFAAFGGALADSGRAKHILLITQVLLATFAFALGLLVSGGHIQFWHLILFAILEGTVIAFDIPAFNTVTPQLVPREDFQQALALNSVSFHLSRVLGPSLAGVIMGYWGPPAVFWVNAISFAGIVFVIAKLPLGKGKRQVVKPSGAFKEVWQYLWTHPLLSKVILQFVVLMSLVFPLIFTTLRLYIQKEFQLDEKQFGLVFSLPGVGALAGSLLFLFASPKNPLRLLSWGMVGIVAFLLALAQAQTLPLTILFLTCFSVSMFLTLSALLVTVQLTVDHEIRGRVSSLIGLAFVALAPMMSVPIGILSDTIGPRNLLVSVAVVFGGISYLLGLYKVAKIRKPNG